MEKINEMGEHDLYWGRPLKSILAIFDNKPLIFQFHHLTYLKILILIYLILKNQMLSLIIM